MGFFDLFRRENKTNYEIYLSNITDKEVFKKCFLNVLDEDKASIKFCFLFAWNVIYSARLLFETLNKRYKLSEPQQVRIMSVLSSFLFTIEMKQFSCMFELGYSFIWFNDHVLAGMLVPSKMNNRSEIAADLNSKVKAYLSAARLHKSVFEMAGVDLAVSITNAADPVLDPDTAFLSIDMRSFILSSEDVLHALKSSLENLYTLYKEELEKESRDDKEEWLREEFKDYEQDVRKEIKLSSFWSRIEQTQKEKKFASAIQSVIYCGFQGGFDSNIASNAILEAYRDDTDEKVLNTLKYHAHMLENPADEEGIKRCFQYSPDERDFHSLFTEMADECKELLNSKVTQELSDADLTVNAYVFAYATSCCALEENKDLGCSRIAFNTYTTAIENRLQSVKYIEEKHDPLPNYLVSYASPYFSTLKHFRELPRKICICELLDYLKVPTSDTETEELIEEHFSTLVNRYGREMITRILKAFS